MADQSPGPHPLGDGRASANSSRGLLMTLLGEFVLPSGGSAWTQTLIGAFDLVSVQEKAARQALARAEADGWLARERHGRRTRWSLTDPARGMLEEGAERIYGFGQTRRAWDGEWIVLLASVPERERATRYRMTQRLSWAGFGPLGQGTWICPWTDREAAAQTILDDLDVEATSFRGPVGALGSGEALARRAWPLDDLTLAYRAFLDDARTHDAPPPPSDAVADLAQLVHRWRRFPFLDPDLPGELLPDGWPGREAAERFAEVRAQCRAPARDWWADRESSLS